MKTIMKMNYLVDNWTMLHEGQGDNMTSNEIYTGKVAMGQVTQHKYLGHFISSAQNNMAHLEKMKTKAFRIKN